MSKDKKLRFLQELHRPQQHGEGENPSGKTKTSFSKRGETPVCFDILHLFICMRILDINSRTSKKDRNNGIEMSQKSAWHP